VLLLASCDALGPSSPTNSPTTSAAASPVANECPAIDLRTPRGARIDLTGAWAGGVTFHEARQEGSCVWWVGSSNWPGDEVGSAWLLTFSGHLSSDFQLTGEWVEIFTVELHGERRCPVTFEIQVEEGPDGEDLILQNLNPGADLPCGYYATTLRRTDGPVP